MKNLLFLFVITAVMIAGCSKTNSTVTTTTSPETPLFNSLWKMTIKSDTSDIVIDSIDFSSFNNNFTSPSSVLFLNNYRGLTFLHKPTPDTSYNYIGGWLYDPASTHDFKIATILQFANLPTTQYSIDMDSAYFKLSADSMTLNSTQILHNTTFLFGQRYHPLDSIRLNRRR